MPDNAQTQQTVIAIDVSAGEAAVTTLNGHYEEIGEGQLRPPTTDVYGGALKALACSDGLSPDLKARFAALPSREFDITYLSLLKPAAQAVLYTRAHIESTQSIDPNARLPVREAEEAVETRARMLRVLEHNLGDDVDGPNGDAVRELQFVRKGRGYRDLAADLNVLARLYRQFASLLARDANRYQAEDAALADRLSGSIHEHLKDKQMRRRTPQELLAARAWTFMVHIYEETAATGRWLTRNEPEYADLFPPLGTKRRRVAAPAEAAQPGPAEPAPDAG